MHSLPPFGIIFLLFVLIMFPLIIFKGFNDWAKEEKKQAEFDRASNKVLRDLLKIAAERGSNEQK